MGRWANKYVIGLTGNIAMGKSVVRKMLEHLGAYTIDADGLAHQTMAPGAPAYHPILETFGRWLLDPDGRINRQKLGGVAFSHPEALALLEAITHPVVRQAVDVLLSRASQPVAVIEAIKLVEGPLADQVDSVWVVDAAPQLQIERLVQKRGMTENEARKRMETQNLQREKLARADSVITNNGSLQDVWVQVEREWRRLMVAFGLADADAALRTVRVSTARAATGQYPAVKPPTGQLATPRPPTGPLGRPVVTQTQTQTMQQVQAQTQSQPAASAQRPPTGQLGTLPALKPKTQTQPLPAAAPAMTAPAASAPAVSAVQSPVPTSAGTDISVDIRRGMPRHADAIAELVGTLTGANLTRSDVMGLFGEKSYLLAETSGRLLGLAGFQVENLITRVDEFLLVKDAPVTAIARALIEAVEDASKALQSEVGFVFLPADAPPGLVSAFTSTGYIQTELDEIKVPAWREAAAESQPKDTRILAKKLRAERVLKPL